MANGKIEVSLLDAVAITVSILRRDFNTASSVMFLLHLGELFEEWTHKKSVDDLAGIMSLKVEIRPGYVVRTEQNCSFLSVKSRSETLSSFAWVA